ncbi:GntR family transcriptional regulator [Adlercreutzia sp. ZJ473]|uniref:GntR family transcriptional regulator n=1 Tax=Adlercreutzia sp. ZJ473 TaxID=2722822 RepID=UPI0015538D69|nr:GntR family transcriptional regulator [Adlercreutzia sp. ZJ473]
MRTNESIVFRVEETSDLPIWVQLRNRIAYLIRSGFFKAGEQLPSVRSLAAEAHINYNTVAKAYRDLELSGLIISIRGRGMFVQNGVSEGDAERLAVDALLENCIRQYRAMGMTYQEISEHAQSVIGEFKRKALEAEEEKLSYGTVQPR